MGVVSANLNDGSGASHSRTVTSCQAEGNLVMGDVHGALGYPGNPHNYFWYTENQALTDAFVGQSYGANLGASDSATAIAHVLVAASNCFHSRTRYR